MTPKEKEISFFVSQNLGKEVNVWLTRQQKKEEPFLEGTIESSTGTYLILKWVLIWNGTFEDEKMISIRSIGQIKNKTI